MKRRAKLSSPLDYLKLFIPLLLFPVVYLPYKHWGIEPFSRLVRLVIYGEQGNPLWTAFNINETVIYFWLAVSAAVTLISVVVAVLRIRPWYFIPLYILVTISLCGILALAFYRLMS